MKIFKVVNIVFILFFSLNPSNQEHNNKVIDEIKKRLKSSNNHISTQYPNALNPIAKGACLENILPKGFSIIRLVSKNPQSRNKYEENEAEENNTMPQSNFNFKKKTSPYISYRVDEIKIPSLNLDTNLEDN